MRIIYLFCVVYKNLSAAKIEYTLFHDKSLPVENPSCLCPHKENRNQEQQHIRKKGQDRVSGYFKDPPSSQGAQQYLNWDIPSPPQHHICHCNSKQLPTESQYTGEHIYTHTSRRMAFRNTIYASRHELYLIST